ncbi:hypothetical protein SAMN05216349_12049 [Oribacterium sp. KHPX15]|uniref:hypothetical protein n=1 Tax=Oribacterium sp. KHPX15 TaxID=1855342 RepID=UPI000894E395|nr:hypothetical protein [Oribacterium sp. KHPX15]SEA64404.1 hypothetical protein SAMN05216349_12049 [Oribacterium sp. KHPX15]
MKQRTGRKLIGFLFALALVLGLMSGMSLTAFAATEYNLWVGGTRVTSENCADIPVNTDYFTKEGNGKASYDNASKTLTLDNYVVKGNWAYDGNSGNSVIYCSNSTYLSTIIIKGNVSLTQNDESGAFFTIDTNINITIEGVGDNPTLTIRSGSTTSAASVGIKAYNLTIKNCTVDVQAGNATSSVSKGIQTNNLTIINSNVTATAQNGSYSYGIGGGGTVTADFDNKSTVTVKGNKYAINGSVKHASAGTGYENYDMSDENPAAIEPSPDEAKTYNTYKAIKFDPPPHTHDFTYSASGATITAECTEGDCTLPLDDNNKHTVTRTLSAADATYTGSAYTGASLSDTTAWTGAGLTAPTIVYEGRGDTTYAKSTTAPTNAGTYTASITVDTDKTATADFTISPIALTIDTATATNRTYVKDSTDVTISGVTFKDSSEQSVALTLGEDQDYTVTGTMTDANAGDGKTVDVTVTLKNTNYSLATNTTTTTVDISKADAQTIADVEVSLPYTATSVSESVAGVMPEDAGTLTYTAGTASKTGNVTVSNFAVDDTSGAVTATLSDGATGNTVTLPVTIGSTNYANSTVNVKITLADKGTQTIIAENVTATYGDTDKKVNATTDGDGAISYAVKDGSADYIDVNGTTGVLTIKKVPEDGKAYVVVTAAETDAYAQATKDVTVTISKAKAVPATVTANNRTYDETEKPLVTVTGEATGGKMQYALGTATEATEAYTSTIPAKTEVGTYHVWYKAVGDDSHADSDPDVVSVTIKEKSEPHEHDIKKMDAKEPTCTEDGYKAHYECTECDKWFEDANGSAEITDKTSFIIDAIGHKWDDGEITKEATYDETGIRTYTCENDSSHTKEEEIPRKTRSEDNSKKHDSSSESSGSSGSSSNKSSSSGSAEIQAKVDQINDATSGIPENHQVETGVPASDVGGRWGSNANADTWTYTKSDGSLAKSEWMSLDYNGLRYWYYFNEDGNMLTNWFDYNGERFYLMPQKDGWRGRMATGWKNIDNKWYYFDIVPGSTQGKLFRSSITPDGHVVGADGAWNGVGETPVGQE